MYEPLKETSRQSSSMSFRRNDDRRQLLVIADNSHMSGLTHQLIPPDGRPTLTPFIRAMLESGSVAILASSRKTIGKSIPCSLREAADRRVVQICPHEFLMG